MIIGGGTYLEECVAPPARFLLGSGGRGTLALTGLEEVTLHTFHPDTGDIEANFGRDVVVHASPALISFRYLHPLARPWIDPFPPPYVGRAELTGDRVLRFGCIEGEFVARAWGAVYDPQGGSEGALFSSNGSVAENLALVLNSSEARQLGGTADLQRAAADLRSREGAEVVVIKHGPMGALVLEAGSDELRHIPAYKTNAVNKIGSGDVFTTMFAHNWLTKKMPPCNAADLASRQTADYVETQVLPCRLEMPMRPPISGSAQGLRVLIAADQDSTPILWLAHEAQLALNDLGVKNLTSAFVFGEAGSRSLLSSCDVVYALSGEVPGPASRLAAAATELGVRCVAFSESASVKGALRAVGVDVVEDFAASLYAVIWDQ